MRLFDGYEIRGLDIRTINIGTSTKPHLYSITAGQRNSKSLIFHIKIENDFHQCHLARVNSTSVNFACIERTCGGRHKMILDPRFVTCIPNFIILKNVPHVIEI